MNWHFRFGYTMASLLLFRLIWGLVGGRWSRFSTFVYAPRTLLNYLRGAGRPQDSVGHSPLGAASVFAMLAFLAAQVVTGMLSDDEISFAGPLTRFVANSTVSLASHYHTAIGKWILLALVLLHLAAIAYYHRRKHRLIAAMVRGDKSLEIALPGSRDDAVSRLAALTVFLICAAGVYWISSLDSPAF
jgi:cytochrome b